MATRGQVLVGVNAIQEFINIVMTPPYNACQWWDTNNPGPHYLRQDHLGPRAVTLPELTGGTGKTIVGRTAAETYRIHAGTTGVYRRIMAGRNWSKWGTEKPHGSGFVGSATALARLNYSYHWQTNAIQFSFGEVLVGSVFTQKLQNLRTAQLPAHNFVHDMRVCHDSCHDNCHASRGRR